MECPDHCIRGILNSTYIDEDDFPSLSVFDFIKGNRIDGWKEASINWMDDEYAIDFTFKQTKDIEELKFKAGIAILPRSELDRIKKLYYFIGNFNYERAEEEGNDYHGNLLLKDKISNHKRDAIRSLLISAAKIIKREDYSIPEQRSREMKDISKNLPKSALFKLITHLKRILISYLKS